MRGGYLNMKIKLNSKNKVKTEKEKTIFVTVGNGKFDQLMIKIDELIERKVITNRVIAQIGLGEYKPKHFQFFTFQDSLEDHYKKADLVISHGGPGTVFEVLRLKRKLIALPNRVRTDPRHQVEYLQAISQESAALLYCNSVEELGQKLIEAKQFKFKSYCQPSCTIHQEIIKFLEK